MFVTHMMRLGLVSYTCDRAGGVSYTRDEAAACQLHVTRLGCIRVSHACDEPGGVLVTHMTRLGRVCYTRDEAGAFQFHACDEAGMCQSFTCM